MTTEEQLGYASIRRYFLEHLFSADEATWAAENNLQPSDARVQKLVRNRELRIRMLMRYLKESEEEAVEDSANSVVATNRAKAEYEDVIIDDYNLFQGET